MRVASSCPARYLRATKWKTSTAAIQRLEVTLKWRREYGIYDVLTAEHIEPEVSPKPSQRYLYV